MTENERATGMPRDEIQDLLPDWVAGRLAPDVAARVEAGVRADPELASEAETLALLHRGRPRAPEGLEARILAAVAAEAREAPGTHGGGSEGSEAPHHGMDRRNGRVRRRPLAPGGWTWGLAAAAVLALALGILDLMDRPATSGGSGSGALDQVAYEEVGSPWADDAVIAGAPVLDGLPEDALSTLLEELEG